jgi:sporulation protein YlmC with PRC-barrel domain
MITKLSKMFGKEIYTGSGAKVGRVADVAIDVDTRRVSDIFISNLDQTFQKKHELEGKSGVIFSYGGIKNVQDIVIISEIKPRIKETEVETTGPEEHTPGIYEE